MYCPVQSFFGHFDVHLKAKSFTYILRRNVNVKLHGHWTKKNNVPYVIPWLRPGGNAKELNHPEQKLKLPGHCLDSLWHFDSCSTKFSILRSSIYDVFPDIIFMNSTPHGQLAF